MKITDKCGTCGKPLFEHDTIACSKEYTSRTKVHVFEPINSFISESRLHYSKEEVITLMMEYARACLKKAADNATITYDNASGIASKLPKVDKESIFSERNLV